MATDRNDSVVAETSHLLATLREWIPAASRVGGLSGFVVDVEDGQPFVCHQTAARLRIPTTFSTLSASERSGLATYSEGWDGSLRDGSVNYPVSGQFDGSFTPLGIMLLLQESSNRESVVPSPLLVVELREALDGAKELVRELQRQIDSGESQNVEDDQDSATILRRVIIPELRKLPTEIGDQGFDPVARIGFFTRLKTFLWDTRVIGLVNLIISLYEKLA